MTAIVDASLPPKKVLLGKNTYLRVLVLVTLLILALGFAALLVYVGMTMGALEPK
jgi:hypothetical protein